jgi:sugar phosphate isomerase/epimerase
LHGAIKGGKDPVELFKQNPGRFPLLHVKDLDATKEIIMPVGEGTIDYKRIFDAASTAGLKYYFIEHDFPKDAYASITTSYNSLTKMLK